MMTKQEVLNYLDNVLHPIVSPDNWNVYSELYDMIEDLPSTEPKYGHWEELRPYDVRCSVCGNSMMDKYPFCPECGAKITLDDKVCPNCGIELVFEEDEE